MRVEVTLFSPNPKTKIARTATVVVSLLACWVCLYSGDSLRVRCACSVGRLYMAAWLWCRQIWVDWEKEVVRRNEFNSDQVGHARTEVALTTMRGDCHPNTIIHQLLRKPIM